MKIGISGDHAGFDLKESVKKYLKETRKDIEIVSYGPESNEVCSYVDQGYEIAKDLSEGKLDKIIVFCGTGIGISIAANKYKGVRCANVGSVEYAKLCREHNDANGISMGGRFVAPYHANMIVDAFLDTPFGGERHLPRVKELNSKGN